MNIDKLAIAIQKDFDKVHVEMGEMKTTMSGMATKNELTLFKNEILAAIAKMDTRLSAYMARTNEDVSKLQGSDKNYDVRLRVLEKRA